MDQSNSNHTPLNGFRLLSILLTWGNREYISPILPLLFLIPAKHHPPKMSSTTTPQPKVWLITGWYVLFQSQTPPPFPIQIQNPGFEPPFQSQDLTKLKTPISSSGFGFSLALHILASGPGHKVIATSRTPSKTPSQVSQIQSLGGTWLALDICSPESELATFIEKATAIYGTIDVLVNNAGYSLLGAFECFR